MKGSRGKSCVNVWKSCLVNFWYCWVFRRIYTNLLHLTPSCPAPDSKLCVDFLIYVQQFVQQLQTHSNHSQVEDETCLFPKSAAKKNKKTSLVTQEVNSHEHKKTIHTHTSS